MKSELAQLREQLKAQALYSGALRELLRKHMKEEDIKRQLPPLMRWLNLMRAIGHASVRPPLAETATGTFRERAKALCGYLRGRAPEVVD